MASAGRRGWRVTSASATICHAPRRTRAGDSAHSAELPCVARASCIRSPRQGSNPSSDTRQSRWWSPSAPADRSWAFDHADSATSRFARLLGFDSRCRSASHGGRAAIRASPRLSRRRSHRCDGVKAKVCRPPMVSQGRDFLRISELLGSRLANRRNGLQNLHRGFDSRRRLRS